MNDYQLGYIDGMAQGERSAAAEIDTLRYLLDAFDRYASIEGGPPYAGSPFQDQVRAALD